MRFQPASHYSRCSLRKKLFGYMLLLVMILLLALASGLFLCGRFSSAQKDLSRGLKLQLEIFEKNMTSYWDQVAYQSVTLSKELTDILTAELESTQIRFDQLTDKPASLTQIQRTMMEPLCKHLQQSDCSGIFVLLDATINSTLENTDSSRCGIYIQKSGTGVADSDLLLYRGIANVGKNCGVMPHRKWRMEFNTQAFPDYQTHISGTNTTLEHAYGLSRLVTLPGTSDQVVLMTVPLLAEDGSVLGLCGFEVSAVHFKILHAQPSSYGRITCLLTTSDEGVLHAEQGLSCGDTQGYYYKPASNLQLDHLRNELVALSGDKDSYVGLLQDMHLSARGEPFTIAVMIPKQDYDQIVAKSVVQTGLLLLLVVFFAGVCCLYFSRRFLLPLLKDLEKLKSDKRSGASFQIPEIEDLFDYLSEQDRLHEETVSALSMEKQVAMLEIFRLQQECQTAQSAYEAAQSNYELAQRQYEAARTEYQQAQGKFEAAQTEIDRLAYDRKKEVDPEEYKIFLEGIGTLTPTENKIFQYYLEGKTVKEIVAICAIKESTVRYHNQNIYGKLGVNSLKQLLRYAALMSHEVSRPST